MACSKQTRQALRFAVPIAMLILGINSSVYAQNNGGNNNGGGNNGGNPNAATALVGKDGKVLKQGLNRIPAQSTSNDNGNSNGAGNPPKNRNLAGSRTTGIDALAKDGGGGNNVGNPPKNALVGEDGVALKKKLSPVVRGSNLYF